MTYNFIRLEYNLSWQKTIILVGKKQISYLYTLTISYLYTLTKKLRYKFDYAIIIYWQNMIIGERYEVE